MLHFLTALLAVSSAMLASPLTAAGVDAAYYPGILEEMAAELAASQKFEPGDIYDNVYGIRDDGAMDDGMEEDDIYGVAGDVNDIRGSLRSGDPDVTDVYVARSARGGNGFNDVYDGEADAIGADDQLFHDVVAR